MAEAVAQGSCPDRCVWGARGVLCHLTHTRVTHLVTPAVTAAGCAPSERRG